MVLVKIITLECCHVVYIAHDVLNLQTGHAAMVTSRSRVAHPTYATADITPDVLTCCEETTPSPLRSLLIALRIAVSCNISITS